jgi:hypothetical protein
MKTSLSQKIIFIMLNKPNKIGALTNLFYVFVILTLKVEEAKLAFGIDYVTMLI